MLDGSIEYIKNAIAVYIERFRKHGQLIPVKIAVELTKFPVVSGYEVVKALNR